MRIGIEKMLAELKRLNPKGKFYVDENYMYHAQTWIHGTIHSKDLILPTDYYLTGMMKDGEFADDGIYIETKEDSYIECFPYTYVNFRNRNLIKDLIKA